jgi:hypothetical protein
MDKDFKKKVTEEWVTSIPQLSAFAHNKFYKIIGCIIIGIELIKLPKLEEYRPHFVIYPLWKCNLKSCLDSPSILMELYNKKGLQFSIPYLNNNVNLHESIIESLKNQVPVLFKDNVTLNLLFNLIDSRFDDILIKSNSAQQAKLFELKFYIALYLGNEYQINNILNQIQLAKKNWNIQMFEIWYGKFEIWIEKLNMKLNIRDEVIKQIEFNKNETKLLSLIKVGLY